MHSLDNFSKKNNEPVDKQSTGIINYTSSLSYNDTLKKLDERRQKTLQITKEQAEERQEVFERFQKLMDQFRPNGSKLYVKTLIILHEQQHDSIVLDKFLLK